MKTYLLISILLLSLTINSYCQKDKDAQKAEKAVNKDAAKSAREANKAFKDKDYYTAIYEAVDALEGELNKKNSKNTAEILTESYSLFEKNSLNIISHLENSSISYSGRNSVSDKYNIVKHYSNLITAQDKLSTLDNSTLSGFGINKSSFADYRPKLESSNTSFLEFANKYCSEQYEKGNIELEKSTKKSAFKAYFHFQEVTDFLPEYEDVKNLKAKAMSDATYKILFVDFGTNYTPPPTSYGYKSVAEYLSGSLDKHKGSKYAPFVKFTVSGYDNELFLNTNNPSGIEAFCKVKEIDAVIFGTYEIPTVTHVDGKPETREIEKEVTVGEKKEIQDGKEVMIPIKQKVKATKTDFSRTNVSKVNGKYYLYDAYQGKYILKEFGIQGEHNYTQRWTMASGDLRVFDEKEQRRFVKEHEAIPDKGNMQMTAISELSKKVEAKSIESLKILFEGN